MPARPNAATPRTGSSVGQQRDADEGDREHERQQVVGASRRELMLDRGESHPAQCDARPEGGERERRHGRRCSELLHVDRGPVAVHRLADAVEQREGGVDPEPRRDAGARSGSRVGRRRLLCAGAQRQRDADDQEPGEEAAGQHRQSPPEAEADEHGDEERRERGAESEQRVEHQDRGVDPGRVERRGEACSTRAR